MAVYFLTYSDDRYGHKGGRFAENQKNLGKMASEHGADFIEEWTYTDLSTTSIFAEHREYFKKSRFDNGAAWKPVIVEDLLSRIGDNDYLFYCDCGDYSISSSIEPLLASCRRSGGMAFFQWGERNSKFTKRDAFVLMDCDTPRIANAPMIQTTWFVIQKSPYTVDLVAEWKGFNLDERIASYVKPNTCGEENYLGFAEHRGDQSILSLLLARDRKKSFSGLDGWQNRNPDNILRLLNGASSSFIELFKFDRAKSVASRSLKSGLQFLTKLLPTLTFTHGDLSFKMKSSPGLVRKRKARLVSYDNQLDALGKLLDTKSKFVDVGAHYGFLSLFAAKVSPKGVVVSIEATSESLAMLEQNAKLNNLSNIQMVAESIYESSENLALQLNPASRSEYNCLGKPFHPENSIVATRMACTKTLTSVLSTLEVSCPDIVYIDVNGAELPILRGSADLLSEERKPIFVTTIDHVCCMGHGYHHSEYFELLRFYGYRTYSFRAGSFTEFKDSTFEGTFYGLTESQVESLGKRNVVVKNA